MHRKRSVTVKCHNLWKDVAILLRGFQQVQEVFVELFKEFSLPCFVVLYACTSGKVPNYLVHAHVVHVLGHLKAKWHIHKILPAIQYPQHQSVLKVVNRHDLSSSEMVRIHCGHLVLKMKIWNLKSPCVTSSNVGTLWFSQILALFQSLCSRYMYIDPLVFLGR